MRTNAKSKGKKLLLMGSSAFKDRELPPEVKRRINQAIEREETIIVGEAHGANRLYQDYLKSKNYRNVIVGHAIRLRYNAGNWKDVQYGENLKERERGMIEDCDYAIVIWMNKSGVIAEDLELLKRTGKPTYVYEYSSEADEVKEGEIDPRRIYDPFYYMKRHRQRHRTTKK